MQDATPFLPGLSPVARKSLTATRDAGNLSSNGGLVVLREAARRLDLAAVIADPLPGRGHPARGPPTPRAVCLPALGPAARQRQVIFIDPLELEAAVKRDAQI